MEGHEHHTGLTTDVHETCCSEATNSEETLGNSVEVGTLNLSRFAFKIGTGLLVIVDEVCGNTDLASDVAELGKSTPEESVLLAKGLVDVSGASSGHLGLVGHIRIGDFR
jgi:hypothetical protein